MITLEDTFDEELGIGPRKKKAKSRKEKRKERRKKILRGVGAVATGGASLAVTKHAPKALRKIGRGIGAVATGGLSLTATKKAPKALRKLGKGLLAVGTGGMSLAAAKAHKKRQESAKKRSYKPLSRQKTTKTLTAATTLQRLAPAVAVSRSLPADGTAGALTLLAGAGAGERSPEALQRSEQSMRARGYPRGVTGRLMAAAQTLSEKADRVAGEKLATTKPRDRRSRFKIQLFSKLRHLASALPVSHPTRVRANMAALDCACAHE